MPTLAQQIPAEVWEIVLRYSFTALSGQRKRGRPKWWLMCRSITAALDLFSLQGSADSEEMLREGIFSLPPAGPPSTPLRFFAQRAAVCALTRSPVEFLQSIKCIDGDFVEPSQHGVLRDRSWIDRDVLQAVSSMTQLKKISDAFLACCWLVNVDLRGLGDLTSIGDCFLSNSTVESVQLPSELASVGASFLAGTRVRQLDLASTRLSAIGTHFLAETPVCRVLLPPTVRCFGNFAFFKVASQELLLTVPSLEELGKGFLEFSHVEVLMTTEMNPELLRGGIAPGLAALHHHDQRDAGKGLLVGGRIVCRLLDLSGTKVESLNDGVLDGFCLIEVLMLPPTLRVVGDRFLCERASGKLDLSRTQLETVGWNFLRQSSIEELLLPPTLKAIGHSFLVGCEKLQRIDLRRCCLESLAANFALKCDCLVEVLLPSTLKVIEDDFLVEFRGRSLDLSETQLQRLGRNFLRNSIVEELLLPATLNLIGQNFLAFCCKLQRIDLQGCCIETLADNFAVECDSLVEVLLPATLKSIENGFLTKFRGRRLDLSHTHLERIGSNFLVSSSVEELLLPTTLISIGDNFFECGKIQKLDLVSCALCALGLLCPERGASGVATSVSNRDGCQDPASGSTARKPYSRVMLLPLLCEGFKSPNCGPQVRIPHHGAHLAQFHCDVHPVR